MRDEDQTRQQPVAMMRFRETVTYLEMTDRSELIPAKRPLLEVEVKQAEIPSPELNRFFYTAIGGDWYWIDLGPADPSLPHSGDARRQLPASGSETASWREEGGRPGRNRPGRRAETRLDGPSGGG